MIDALEATDRQLALDFLDGSEAAFRTLYRRHTPRVRALVLRLLGSGDEAEDAVQESWLRACAALERFRWESALSTWLCGIAVRVTMEAVRRRESRRGDEAPAAARAAEAGWTPADGIDLERALAALPPRQRAVLLLHDLEGYTHEEIGELLGIVEGTSKSQLAHAREALRAALA